MDSAMGKRGLATMEGSSASELCSVGGPATETAACGTSTEQGEHLLRSSRYNTGVLL